MHNIYLIKEPEGLNEGVCRWMSAVVVADSVQEARLIHPANNDDYCYEWNEKTLKWMRYDWDEDDGGYWISPGQVIVCLVGVTDLCRPGEVICASDYGT